MTIATIANKNNQQEELIQNALKIKDSSSKEKTLKELGISEKDASSKIQKALNFKAEEILFPPRIIALLVFLGIVLAANKFICGWACQFGTLKDFIFRLNRDSKDKEGIFKQYKIPFYISNTIRIVFFILFTFIAFVWSFDIVEAINPFTIFKPAALTSISIVFIFLLLVSSLFIYRPWCHLFCPFGLLGWIVKKCSRYKI
ncbi:4Fe-4S binding protein [Clostridium scatologenes]|uniref:4Fe-4S ferredoxin iron-sulfur binding domain-containing protein n=1 Tax=Clostridium scatologenes TaxID=1548 RepID=A0A0E3M868_CLOSL|nr:4Fe-4S binding protein [Clostridium scatologenes]AKA67903.1 4Fe-4S ferredoxin iron-sulfur binding domain-containing protein [Clostridium scatologenes]